MAKMEEKEEETERADQETCLPAALKLCNGVAKVSCKLLVMSAKYISYRMTAASSAGNALATMPFGAVIAAGCQSPNAASGAVPCLRLSVPKTMKALTKQLLIRLSIGVPTTVIAQL
jgi:hypothetical protein